MGLRQERAYVLVYEADQDCAWLPPDADAVARKTLWSWAPGEEARPVVDLTGHDRRADELHVRGLLVMGQVGADADGYGGHDVLYRLDEDTLAVLDERETDTWYWGTRTAPSRRWVAVADNAAEDHPLHVLDPRTLEAVEVATGAAWLELAWMNRSDRLVGFVWRPTRRPTCGSGRSTAGTRSRGPARGRRGCPRPRPTTRCRVSSPTRCSRTRGSPCGPTTAPSPFPARRADGDPTLIVVDPATGVAAGVDGVSGPVAWTPDGSSIVGWADDGLVVVDPETLETERVPLPTDGLPAFFVSRDGNDVLVSDLASGDLLTLVTSTPARRPCCR